MRIAGRSRRLHQSGTERGCLVPLRDHAQLPCAGHRLGAAAHAELSEDVGEVFLYGIDGDEELPGDLPVRLACGDEPEDLELSFAQ